MSKNHMYICLYCGKKRKHVPRKMNCKKKFVRKELSIYSMVVLGDAYSKGELQDEEKAFEYFRQAAMIGCENQN